MPNSTTVIPCEPFEADVYDVTQDRFIRRMVTGYMVAIREIETFPNPGLLTPINHGSGAKHGIIAVPKWDGVDA